MSPTQRNVSGKGRNSSDSETHLQDQCNVGKKWPNRRVSFRGQSVVLQLADDVVLVAARGVLPREDGGVGVDNLYHIYRIYECKSNTL